MITIVADRPKHLFRWVGCVSSCRLELA